MHKEPIIRVADCAIRGNPYMGRKARLAVGFLFLIIMILGNLGWWLIIISNLVGYFIFRFGMVSRGNSKDYIEFAGGVILSCSFILMFWVYGVKNGLILIPIFWIIITPIVEIFIGKIYKKINEPYEEFYKLIAQKYNTTPEEVRRTIYKDLEKSDDEIVAEQFNNFLKNRPKTMRQNKSKETKGEFPILGETFPKEDYPMLFRWFERNPQTLEDQVRSVADAWHEGDIASACQALESDLQHG